MSLPPGTFPNALYKLINVAYPNQAADLIYGNPIGPVSGFQRNESSNNQNWYLEVIGVLIALRNGAATGTYANVYSELDGAPIVGRNESRGWKFHILGREPTKYLISTADDRFFWTLENGDNYFTVLLRPPSNGLEQQWTIGPP